MHTKKLDEKAFYNEKSIYSFQYKNLFTNIIIISITQA